MSVCLRQTGRSRRGYQSVEAREVGDSPRGESGALPGTGSQVLLRVSHCLERSSGARSRAAARVGAERCPRCAAGRSPLVQLGDNVNEIGAYLEEFLLRLNVFK